MTYLDLELTGKSDFAEQRQREQAARLFNKPAQYVTEQDILDVGNMQQVQAVSDSYENLVKQDGKLH